MSRQVGVCGAHGASPLATPTRAHIGLDSSPGDSEDGLLGAGCTHTHLCGVHLSSMQSSSEPLPSVTKDDWYESLSSPDSDPHSSEPDSLLHSSSSRSAFRVKRLVELLRHGKEAAGAFVAGLPLEHIHTFIGT